MEYLLQSSSWGEKPEVNHPCVLQMKLSALEIAQFLMLTTTSLLPHCCQPAHSCKGEQSNSFCCWCCRKQPSACACCSAQQTAATAPTESCNAELHGRLCSVFDGLKWYMFNTPFLLCVKKLFYIFDCISCFLRSLWYFVLSGLLESDTVLICSTEDLQYKSWPRRFPEEDIKSFKGYKVIFQRMSLWPSDFYWNNENITQVLQMKTVLTLQVCKRNLVLL